MVITVGIPVSIQGIIVMDREALYISQTGKGRTPSEEFYFKLLQSHSLPLNWYLCMGTRKWWDRRDARAMSVCPFTIFWWPWESKNVEFWIWFYQLYLKANPNTNDGWGKSTVDKLLTILISEWHSFSAWFSMIGVHKLSMAPTPYFDTTSL